MKKSKHSVRKPKLRCFWGRKTEAQASFGVDPGSLWGDPGETLGGQKGVRGESEGSQGRVGGGHPEADFVFSFLEV